MTEPNTSRPDCRRIDVFGRGDWILCIARSREQGSLARLFYDRIPELERMELGAKVLEWLDRAEQLPEPNRPLRFPEELLPEGWDGRMWEDFMVEAALCGVERVDSHRLLLRPYKNLHPVGEEFSHEGGHALDCAPNPAALGSGVRAALGVSHGISQVRRINRAHSGAPQLLSTVTEQLERLGARLFDRPPRPEVVEVAEGFFVLPAPLRQLLFDVVWRRGSELRDRQGETWRIAWYPITDLTPLRAYALMRVLESDRGQWLIRLDSAHPSDPELYFLPTGRAHDAGEVLGPPASEELPAGPRLAAFLGQLAPASA